MYDVAHIFLRWTRVQILCERHVEADFLCESNLGVIEIFLLSLKVSFDSFDCY